ncbi:MAG: hypothetical protein R3C97_03890 [Geminicoccaceae bacterium]
MRRERGRRACGLLVIEAAGSGMVAASWLAVMVPEAVDAGDDFVASCERGISGDDRAISASRLSM